MDSLKIDRIPFNKTMNHYTWYIYIYIIYPLWTTGFDNPKNLQPTSCQHVATTEVLCLLPDLRPNQGALIFGLQTNTPKPRVLSGQTDSRGTKESGPLDSRYPLNEFQGRVNPKMAKSKASHRFDIQTRVETWFEYECRWMSHLLHLYGCTVHIMSLKSSQIDTIFGGIQNEHSEIKWVTNKHSHAKKLKPPAGGMELGQSRFTWRIKSTPIYHSEILLKGHEKCFVSVSLVNW